VNYLVDPPHQDMATQIYVYLKEPPDSHTKQAGCRVSGISPSTILISPSATATH
jgi:hypothetical protein